MDIRSIIDSEDRPSQRKTSIPIPARQEYRPSPTKPPTVYEAQAPVYDNHRDVRPPQPSPLQTAAQNGFQFPNGPLHNTVPSPYQHPTSAGSSSGPYPPHSLSQSPSRSHPPTQYPQREGHSVSAAPSNRSFGQSTPLSQTPTSSTPGSAGAYSNFPHPTSSHSIPTPNAAQHPPAFFRESPQPSHTQIRSFSQSQPSQQYVSQPGTPLGPPSSYRRSSFNPLRESPGSQERQRNLSGGCYSQPQSATLSPAIAPSPHNYRDQRSQSSMHESPPSREREKSVSVSPKTKLPDLPVLDRRDPLEVLSDQSSQWSGNITPAKRKAEPESLEAGNTVCSSLYRSPSRVTSIGVHGLLNAESSEQTQERAFLQQQTKYSTIQDPDRELHSSLLMHTSHTLPEPPPDSNRIQETAFGQQQTKSLMNQNSDTGLYSSLPMQTSNNLPKPPSEFSQESARATSISKPYPTQIPVQHRPLTPPATMRTTSDSSTKPPVSAEFSTSIKLKPSTARNGISDSGSKPLKNEASWSMTADANGQSPVKEDNIEATQSGTNLSSEPAKKKPRLREAQNNPLVPFIEKPFLEISKTSAVSQPDKKKPPRVKRWQDVPVYAHSVRGPKRTAELFALSSQGRGTAQFTPPARQTQSGVAPVQNPSQVNGNAHVNGHVTQTNGVHTPVVQPTLANNGPLGPWEPSILNIIPSEELVRIVSDWLFEHVVMRDDVGVGPAGGAASQGAVLEVEAKIGRLEHKHNNERISIPVLNECVVSQSDSSLNPIFKSSMTEVSSLYKLSSTSAH